MDTAGSTTCTRMVRTAAEAELGVLIMFWTLLQSTGKGEGRGPRSSGLWKDKTSDAGEGWGQACFRGGPRKQWRPLQT